MFELKQAQKITKSLLLERNSQEMYFEHYLGVPVKKGLFTSPSCIRIDHKPTCAFYKNKAGVVMFKDFFGPSFDFIGCVQYLHKCSFYEALKIIANDFNIIPDDSLQKNLPKIEYTYTELKITERARILVEIQPFSEKELNWWNSFGISLNTLKKFKVYSIKSIFLNGNYFGSSSETSPIFGYYGGEDIDGNSLWRLYKPTKRTNRFLSNWPANLIQGVKQLPKQGDCLIITKSLKDVMVLREFGFNAISPNSETVMITDSQYRKMKNKFKNIILLYDNDLAGVVNANKYRKQFNIKCIFIKRKYSKDISDLYKKISNIQFWLVIDEINNIFSDNSITNTKHFYIFNGKEN